MSDYPDTPITREEQYLAAGLDGGDLPDPITREEQYLYEIATKMQGGGGSSITVEPLTVTTNGTTTAPSGTAYSPVTANVPNSYGASDEGKVVNNGALVAQTAHAPVTANGTIDTTLNNSVTVAVPIQQSKSVTIDEGGTVTIAPDSGYEAMEEVVVTAEVPSVSTASLVTTFTDEGAISGSVGRAVNSALGLFRAGTGTVTGVLSDGNKASLISETYTNTINCTLVFATQGVTTTVSVTDGAVAITGERGVTSVAMYKTTISYPS